MMNTKQLNLLFQNYINRFEEISFGEHDETYKWEIVQKFQDAFDIAASDFQSMLKNICSASGTLIDGAHQLPFFALVDYSGHEPDTVRQMFSDLYEDDKGDLAERQKKIDAFIAKSEELRKKYKPDSWMYVNDQRSVMSYLFLHDPDHNYLYKATQVHEFAECVEFYDDIGYGTEFKLPIYYRMCDELVAQMQSCDELMAVNQTRFDGKRRLYPDTKLHILCFDMIYSSQVYGLYNGIAYTRLSSAERLRYKERKTKASQLLEAYQEVQADVDKLEKIKAILNENIRIGTAVRHKSFGDGVVEHLENGYASIRFSDSIGEKRFEIMSAFAGGFLLFPDPGLEESIREAIPIMKSAPSLPNRLKQAEKDLAPFKDFLE